MPKGKEPKFKFDLGDVLKDKATGFTGISMCRTQWHYTCNTYGLRSPELKDGIPIEDQFFDEPQLEVIERGRLKEPEPEPEEDEGPGGQARKIKIPNRRVA